VQTRVVDRVLGRGPAVRRRGERGHRIRPDAGDQELAPFVPVAMSLEDVQEHLLVHLLAPVEQGEHVVDLGAERCAGFPAGENRFEVRYVEDAVPVLIGL
jgi:hypothetical protein